MSMKDDADRLQWERDDEPTNQSLPVNSCSRCNAGMPSFRVNPLCEDCYAEESDEYDYEAEVD